MIRLTLVLLVGAFALLVLLAQALLDDNPPCATVAVSDTVAGPLIARCH